MTIKGGIVPPVRSFADLFYEIEEIMLRVEEMIDKALLTDGSYHKQWYLERIADILGIEVNVLGHKPGVAP